jgi:hypothetical protein
MHDAAAGLAAAAAGVKSIDSFYDSDSELFKNATSLSLLAQQQRLVMQYDIFAAVYQFTQVPRACCSSFYC